MHHALEQIAAVAHEVGMEMERKSSRTHEHLHGEHEPAEQPEAEPHALHQRHGEKAHGKGAGDDGHPFHLPEEAVLRVVGDAEDEVSDKAAEREEEDPLRPFQGVRFDGAVHDEQQADAGVGQRRGEGRGVNEAGDGPLLEELALEMQHKADDADEHGHPADEIAQRAPEKKFFLGQRPDGGEQEHGRGEGEDERHPFHAVMELVDAVREEDVRRESAEVEQGEQFHPRARLAQPVILHCPCGVGRLLPSSPPCAGGWDSCRAIARSRPRP